MLTQIPINNINRKKKALSHKFKIIMCLNKPINKGGSNRFLYILLMIHIIRVHSPFLFIIKHYNLNITAIIGYMINIIQSLFIEFMHFTDYLFFDSMMEHLNFL